jgi:hypothetical protein
LIPPAVQEEFLSAEKETRRKTLRDETWIQVVELEYPNRVRAFAGLDEAGPVIKSIQEAGLYLHEELIARVLHLAGEK